MKAVLSVVCAIFGSLCLVNLVMSRALAMIRSANLKMTGLKPSVSDMHSPSTGKLENLVQDDEEG